MWLPERRRMKRMRRNRRSRRKRRRRRRRMRRKTMKRKNKMGMIMRISKDFSSPMKPRSSARGGATRAGQRKGGGLT